jgi:conjugative transfer pilus assembly protein TraH
MINGQQLIAVFRAIASNAAALAFKAAIHTISPGLDQLITEFQALLQNMNNLAKNSCAMAHTLLQTTDRAIGTNLEGAGNQGAAQSGLFTDVFAGLQSYVSDANGFFKTAAKFNPSSGNQIMKAAVNSGASSILGVVGLSNSDGSSDDSTNPNDLNNRILVSLLGYSVAGVPCSSANQAGTQDGSTVVGNDSGRIVCRGNNTITLEDFVMGGGPGSAAPSRPLVLWYCLNPSGDSSSGAIDPQICTQMQKQNFNYSGVRGWVNTVLFGSGDASTITASSIVGMLNAGNGSNLVLSDAQRAFVANAGQPVLNLLMRARRSDDRVAMAMRLREPIENCVAAELGRALVRSAYQLTDANSFELSSDILVNREHLREDTLRYVKACSQDRTKESLVQYLNDSATLMTRSNK